jgi:hypothetical protein
VPARGGGGCILTGMERIRVEQHGFAGLVWIGAWLFTIGYLHLAFWKGVLAMVLWPYYLGVAWSSLLH